MAGSTTSGKKPAARKSAYKTREQLATEARAAKAATKAKDAELEALRAQLAQAQSVEGLKVTEPLVHPALDLTNGERQALYDAAQQQVDQEAADAITWEDPEDLAAKRLTASVPSVTGENALLLEALTLIRGIVDRQDEQEDEIERLRRRKSKQRTQVGTREDDRTIRNLTSRLVHVRLGNPKDPYRIELQARGSMGDVADVPASLVGHTAYKRNVQRLFEEITSDEAAAIVYGVPGRGFDVSVSRDEDRTIARFDPKTGRELGGPVGPRYAMAPGADRQLTQAAEGNIMDHDPEYAAYLDWKRQTQGSQGIGGVNMDVPQGYVPPGAQVQASLLDRLNAAARSGDQEAAAMARKLNKMVENQVIPAGELNKPVRIEHSTVSVQPNLLY